MGNRTLMYNRIKRVIRAHPESGNRLLHLKFMQMDKNYLTVKRIKRKTTNNEQS